MKVNAVKIFLLNQPFAFEFVLNFRKVCCLHRVKVCSES